MDDGRRDDLSLQVEVNFRTAFDNFGDCVDEYRKRQPSPETSHQHDVRGPFDRTNGANGHSGSTDMLSPADMNGNHAPETEGVTNISSRRYECYRH